MTTTFLWTSLKQRSLLWTSGSHSRSHIPFTIDGSPVDTLSSFRFLGLQMSGKLRWLENNGSILTDAHQWLCFLRWLNKRGLSMAILTSFCHGTIRSILASCVLVWFGRPIAHYRKAIQKVVKSAQQITGTELPPVTSCSLTSAVTWFSP